MGATSHEDASGPPPAVPRLSRALLAGRIDDTGLRLTAASGEPVRLGGDLAVAATGRLQSPGETRLLDRLRTGQRGLAVLDGLRGAFVLAFADRRTGAALLARDPLGARQLYVHRTGGGVVFSDDPAALLALLDRSPEPDDGSVAQWLGTGTLPVGRSLYAGVERLAPGQALVRSAGGTWSLQPWWTIEPQAPLRLAGVELEDYVLAGVDAALARAVADDLSPAVMVSGGLDSSTVLASAARARRARGVSDPVAYAAVFPGRPAVDESALVAELTAHVGIECVAAEPPTAGGALAGARSHLERWKLPAGSPNHFLWGGLLGSIHAAGHRVVLDGEGGDELFGAPLWHLADAVARGQLRTAWRDGGRVRQTTAVTSRRARLRLLTGIVKLGFDPRSSARPPRVVSGLLRPEARRQAEAYDRWSWRQRSGPLAFRRLAHALTDERELLDAHGYLHRRAAGAGLEARHPFMHDVELVELCAAVPPSALFDARLDRPVLRRALRGRVPEAIRLRPDKSFFTSVLAGVIAGPDRAAIDALVFAPGAEVSRWVDPRRVREQLAAAPSDLGSDAAGRWAMGLFRLATVEDWLRTL